MTAASQPASESPTDGSSPGAAGALAPYRVLDLTTDRAWFTGKLLADLGADVVKVEPPGGDPGRVKGPYAGDIASPENSLQWWAFNRGKRSITLDLASADGRGLFLALVSTAHAVLESYEPGQLERWGLGLDVLLDTNPSIVLTRITPFGQTGPYAHLKATDLILAAIAGPAWMAGDSDRPPVRTSTPQYFQHAAAEAAVHTNAALYHAASTGVGQQIDVSAQLAASRTTMNALATPFIDGTILQRSTFGEPVPAQPYRSIYHCADGNIMATVGFGPGLKGYLGWLRAEGVTLPAFLEDLTDDDFGPTLLEKQPPEFPTRVSEVLAEFFATRGKQDLTTQALVHRLMVVPINNVADIYDDVQLNSRDYFQPVEHDGRDPVLYPSTWVHLTQTPLASNGRAPRIGEHNTEILVGELGVDPADMALYQEARVV
ncbi:MAG: CoA transferase [Jatrophihabitantaceae bacterium]|nr:CoA transferase [Jatrophihabitantaceae bacterium]